MGPRGRRALTKKQRKLFEFLVKHPDATLREIAEATGYTDDGASKAINHSKALSPEYWRELMQKHPNLRDAALVKKVSDGLNSKTTKFFAHEGRVEETREVEDTHLQKDYTDLALRMTGAPAAQRVEVTGKGGGPVQHQSVDMSFLTLELIEKILSRLNAIP